MHRGGGHGAIPKRRNNNEDRARGSQSNVNQSPRSYRRMSGVNMPSQQNIQVVVPARVCDCVNRCDMTMRRHTLRPNGQMSRREYQIVAQQMTTTIVQHDRAGGGGHYSKYRYVRIEKLQNCCLWKQFRNRERELAEEFGYVNERMLFHGSNAADQIARTGFDQECARPGGMFGTGIYFAEHSSKSNQYVFGYLNSNGCPRHGDSNCFDCERQLLLCRVALGRMFVLEDSRRMRAPPDGFSSVKGQPTQGGLRYPEYVVYQADQAYPEYLITYKILPPDN